MAKKRPPPGPANREYQPTAQERIKLQAQEARKHAATAPRLKIGTRAGLPNIEPDHSDSKVGSALLMEAIGTCDPDFTRGLIKYMVAAVEEEEGRVDEAAINFMLAVVKDIKPTDQLEAMLAAEMAALHVATMMHSRMLYRALTLEQQNGAVNGLNKCARSFAMLMEALKRYRTGGQQTVTVQHVSVSEGAPRQPPTPLQKVLGGEGLRSLMRGKLRCQSLISRSEFRSRPSGDEKMKKSNRLRNTGPMLSSLRCGAKTRSGKPCMSPAVGGRRRCRMHGGAPGSGAPRGNKNALKHGHYTREAMEARRQLRNLLQQSRILIRSVN
jgi:hypothetical protein